MTWAVAAAAVIFAAVIWALLPNPGFTPGIDHRGRARHPFFTAGLMTFAHRGGELEMPGERMESFRRAVELGVDAFELDVRLSADGIPMVCHDAMVDRTTNGTGRVGDLSADQLQELDGAFWWPHQDEPDRHSLRDPDFPWRGKGLRMVTLKELFDAFPTMRMNIDCKDHRERAIAELAVLVDRYDRFDLTLVASFSHASVAEYRERFPGAATAASRREAAGFFVLSALRLGRLAKPSFQALQVPATLGRLRVITRHFVSSAHHLGINVAAWTINGREEMERLAALEVDGIISDRPSLLLEVVGRRG
jgi:glycerophosphoryl diester phosphodiesterase